MMRFPHGNRAKKELTPTLRVSMSDSPGGLLPVSEEGRNKIQKNKGEGLDTEGQK